MKVESELNVGDTAFFMRNNQVNEAVIREIFIRVTNYGIEVSYLVGASNEGTKDCFKSKKELLDSL